MGSDSVEALTMSIASSSKEKVDPNNPVTPRNASTVVLLRDGENGVETLMLKRNRAVIFAGGAWVFPGGSIDRADLDAAQGDASEAARLAACREADEEAGICPAPESLVLLSHWTTPVAEPKRFATWIYAAPIAADAEVVIDGSEIHESRWIPVQEALDAHRAGEFAILPPTFITLSDLARFKSVAELLAAKDGENSPEVLPVLDFVQDGEKKRPVTMYRGDAGYESGDCSTPGARHRSMLVNRVWHYQHEGVDAAFPSFIGK